jgi:multisubunit Na+/H+ antiporter MnhB subunit
MASVDALTVPFGALADVLLLLHAAFVLFVIAGGFLVLRWPNLAWVHLPAAAWGAAIEFLGFICPLTPVEKAWRQAAGERAYEGGFIEHYVTAALYPTGLTRTMQLALGTLVLAVNGWVYWRVWQRRRIRDAGWAE